VAPCGPGHSLLYTLSIYTIHRPLIGGRWGRGGVLPVNRKLASGSTRARSALPVPVFRITDVLMARVPDRFSLRPRDPGHDGQVSAQPARCR